MTGRLGEHGASLARRTAEAEARAFRAAFRPLMNACRAVVLNARAGEPIEGIPHKRVRADLIEELLERYWDAEELYEPEDRPGTRNVDGAS